MAEFKDIRKGVRVKWTGKAQGGSKDHEGIVDVDPVAGHSNVKVKVQTTNARTGALNKAKFYNPYISQLTVVKEGAAKKSAGTSAAKTEKTSGTTTTRTKKAAETEKVDEVKSERRDGNGYSPHTSGGSTYGGRW